MITVHVTAEIKCLHCDLTRVIKGHSSDELSNETAKICAEHMYAHPTHEMLNKITILQNLLPLETMENLGYPE